MNYETWMLNQFKVSITAKGRVCFQTPLANYTFSKKDWEKVKEQINEV